MTRQNASTGMQITQNWKEWLIYPDGCTAIQRHLNRLEKQADRTLMKFKKGKRKVLNLSRNNSHAPGQPVGQLAGKQLSREGSEGPDRYQAEPAMHSLQQGRQMVS